MNYDINDLKNYEFVAIGAGLLGIEALLAGCRAGRQEAPRAYFTQTRPDATQQPQENTGEWTTAPNGVFLPANGGEAVPINPDGTIPGYPNAQTEQSNTQTIDLPPAPRRETPQMPAPLLQDLPEVPQFQGQPMPAIEQSQSSQVDSATVPLPTVRYTGAAQALPSDGATVNTATTASVDSATAAMADLEHITQTSVEITASEEPQPVISDSTIIYGGLTLIGLVAAYVIYGSAKMVYRRFVSGRKSSDGYEMLTELCDKPQQPPQNNS